MSVFICCLLCQDEASSSVRVTYGYTAGPLKLRAAIGEEGERRDGMLCIAGGKKEKERCTS